MTTPNPREVVSVIDVVTLADIEDRVDELLRTSFSRTERARFEKRPIQAIAGQIALKTAVCQLARETLGAGHIAPRDIDIAREAGGSPAIRNASTPDAAVNEALESRVRVSISHSRTRAVGLAALARRRG
jgi:phosphopantetheine--protein transferase-like protein